MKVRSGRWRRTGVFSVIVAVGAALCLLVFSTGHDSPSGAELLVVTMAYFTVVFGAISLGGRHGIMGLWALLLVLWMLVLHYALSVATWDIRGAIQLLPSGFTLWSAFALPLFVATAVFLHGRRLKTIRTAGASAGLALWVSLLLLSSYLTRFAPDVGLSPRHIPVVIVIVGGFIPPLPIIVSWWSIRRCVSQPTEGTAPR
jgi:hypothetical protein